MTPMMGVLFQHTQIGSRIRENSQYAFDKGLVPTMDGTYGYPGGSFYSRYLAILQDCCWSDETQCY